MSPEKETEVLGKVDRRDLFVSFTDWLYRARRDWGLPLIYRTADLKQIRIWDLGEDGAFYQRYRNQYEGKTIGEQVVPASRLSKLTFYPEKDLPLHRPEPMDFKSGDARYPLEGSSRVERCKRCRGQGLVGYRSSERRCSKCDGEGEVLKYKEKYYHWYFTTHQSPILSQNTGHISTTKMVEQLMEEGGGLPIEAINEAEVLRVSNLLNARIRDLVAYAQGVNAEYKQKHFSREDVLFKEEKLFYVPLSYINLEVGKKFGQYFLAGDGKKSKGRRPPLRLHPLKIVAWSGLALYPLLGLASILGGGTLPVGAWIAPVLAAVPLAISGWQERKLRPLHETWLVLDNAAMDGRKLGFLLAWDLSRKAKAHIDDPAFTHVMENPEAKGAGSRNSFMYHWVIPPGEGKGRRIEVLDIQQESLFAVKDSKMAKNAPHWLIMVGQDWDKAEEIKYRVLFLWRESIKSPLPEITVVINGYLGEVFQDLPQSIRSKMKFLHLDLSSLQKKIQKGGSVSGLEPLIERLIPNEQPKALTAPLEAGDIDK